MRTLKTSATLERTEYKTSLPTSWRAEVERARPVAMTGAGRIRSDLGALRNIARPPVHSPRPASQPASQQPSSPSAKHTILFLAANPVGTGRLALDKEARAIQVELERSGFRDSFELVTRWAAEPLDLLRELRKLKPTIVHFSGHSTFDGANARPAAEELFCPTPA